MPDDRLFHPRARQSQKVGQLSYLEKWVWLSMIWAADNFGVLPDEPALVMGPDTSLRREKYDTIRAAMDKVVNVGLFLRWEHQGDRFLCDPRWQDFQNIRWPRQTYNPVPGPTVFGDLSEKTQELFLRLHPTYVGASTEKDFVSVLVERLPSLIGGGERIREIEREVRIGDYRMDVVVTTSRRRLVMEVKRQPLTPTHADQVCRYQALLASDGGSAAAVLVGPSLGPMCSAETLAARGIAIVLMDRDGFTVLVNPHENLVLRGQKLLAIGGDEPATSRRRAGKKPVASDHRLKANGYRLTAKAKADDQEGGSGGKESAAVAKPHPIKALLTAYDEKFTARFGAHPVVDGGKDASHMSKLLKQFGHEEVMGFLDAFFASTDPWICQSGYTVGVFYKCVNKLIAERSGRGQRVTSKTAGNIPALREFVALAQKSTPRGGPAR